MPLKKDISAANVLNTQVVQNTYITYYAPHKIIIIMIIIIISPTFNIQVFLNRMPCKLVNSYLHLGGAVASIFIVVQGGPFFNYLNPETVNSSETLVIIYQSTCSNIPEDLNVHEKSCNNLKPHISHLNN